MTSDLGLGYVREFARLLTKGGLLVFQMPEQLTLGTALRQWLRNVAGPRQGGAPAQGPVMEMHGTPRASVLANIPGCRLIRAERDFSAGREWISHQYWVTRD